VPGVGEGVGSAGGDVDGRGERSGLSEAAGRVEPEAVGLNGVDGDGLGTVGTEADGDGDGDGDGDAELIGAPPIGLVRDGDAAEVDVPPVASATAAITPISTIAVAMPTTSGTPGCSAQPAARCRGR
jgi:hypothetical protein